MHARPPRRPSHLPLLGALGLALAASACVLPPYGAVGKACDEAHVCPDELACVSGVCGECGNAGECGLGQVCTAGLCGHCSASAPCPRGETCGENGVCQSACTHTLQSLVDAAAPGELVVVPACVYRETVNVTKPLTLSGRPGAELRGSDVWSAWTQQGAVHVGGSVPALAPHGSCAPGDSRCLWPEQVFLDGAPLQQVASNPAPGQFALNVGRAVVLGEDPAGRTVEVTVRRRWLRTQADGVTVRGLSFRHAASDEQGALSNDGRSAWRLEGSRLSDTHGVTLFVDRGSSVVVERNVMERAGQLAVNLDGTSEVRLEANTLSDGNTEGFDPQSPAGGISAHASSALVLRGNTVSRSRGTGIECRRDCTGITVAGNRVHHQRQRGIYLSSSTGAVISGNVVWESSWDDSDWAWGGGIVVWAASDVEVHDNLVAWCPDGISVISQSQSNPKWLITQVRVHHNQVFGTDDPADETLWNLDLGWAEDWAGAMFEPASANRGWDNRFWNDQAESVDTLRFAWASGGLSYLADFVSVPGGAGSAYLTTEQKNAALTAAGVPIFPEPH